MLFDNKGIIYHIEHMYIQPFTQVVDWPEMWRLMEVSTVLYLQILRFYLGRQKWCNAILNHWGNCAKFFTNQ